MGFKVGDVVKSVYSVNNHTYTVEDVQIRESVKLKGLNGWVDVIYFDKVKEESPEFEAIAVVKDVGDKFEISLHKSPRHYSYQFTTSSPDAIDWNKIAKDCKEWGVLLVEHSNKAFIVVSDKLFVKALACGVDESPFKEDDQETIWVDFHTIRPISKKDIPSIKEWVNKVINAKWVNSKSTTVVVKEIM